MRIAVHSSRRPRPKAVPSGRAPPQHLVEIAGELENTQISAKNQRVAPAEPATAFKNLFIFNPVVAHESGRSQHTWLSAWSARRVSAAVTASSVGLLSSVIASDS